ncbi:MAG: hypothetical protein ACOC2U_04560 [bacterium]
MKLIIHLGDKPVALSFSDFEEEVDVDKLTSIDYSNLFGESVTVSALLNQIGLLKAEAEKTYSEKKLEFDIYEAELRRNIRKDYSKNQLKLTEKNLDEEVTLDKAWQISKKTAISAKRDLDFIDALYWSIQSKDRKLSVLVKGVTPEELYNELVEGTINNIVIKKVKSPLK